MPDQSNHSTVLRSGQATGLLPDLPDRLLQNRPLLHLRLRLGFWQSRPRGRWQQNPNGFQTEIVRPSPVMAGYSNSLPPGSQPWIGSQPERLAKNPASPEMIRPSVPAAPGTQPPAAPPSGVQPSSETARPYQGIASPFDPTQFSLPTLGIPPGMGTREPTPEIKREYGQFVERENAPENTIQVVVGRAKVIVFREKPRRIYIPDEAVAGFQVVTDQQFAIVGKKIGRTVLNLWFPDPRDPNDPSKDRTLSYMVVVLPDPERTALDVVEERKRLEAQVKAYTQALKELEQEIRRRFPTVQSNSRWSGIKS